jgi:dTDP-3,4-didehydro-2,6-dideoxy-alpha-D-glucose 3-reductase
MRKIKIGVLGGANIAFKSVIPALLELREEFELVAIASRDAVKSGKLAEKYNITGYSAYQDLVNDFTIDAIYIPLPNALHYEWVRKSLLAGKHVLVEKSMGCNVKEVEELNQVARSNDLALVENFQFRFHGQLRIIKEIISSGKIGELRSLKAYFGFPPFPDDDNIRYKKELGGGALLDAGAYPIKIAQEFLKGALQVTGAKSTIDSNRGIDIWGGGFIEEKEGSLFLQFSFGFDHFYQNSVELWGSKGRLQTNRIFTAPPGYSPEIYLETAEGKEKIIVPAENHFVNMLQHFHAVVLKDNLKLVEYQQNSNQSKLIEGFSVKANE